MFDRLPEDAQTLYAELLALLLTQEAERDWSHLSGSFTSKIIKGREYVYFQYSDPGGVRRQFSVGPRDRSLDSLTARYAERRQLREADLEQISRLAGLLGAAGAALVPHGPARVIRALADAGLFRAGGVLIGSYGFLVLGNMLGVRWPGAAWRTQDIDVAGHLRLAVPYQDTDVPQALDSLEMGFVPVPQLDPNHPSTSFRVRGKQLRVDLCTPGNENEKEPVFIPRFNASAAPIRYLSLIIEGAQPVTAIEGRTATLVVVPAPARYALHKLMVSRRRAASEHTKTTKDLHQAALLLEVLAEDRPLDLEQAAKAFAGLGPAVTSKVVTGLDAVTERWPETTRAATVIRPALEG
ncbi:MAG: nucleotidyltransferase domain-containing protein [Planctomycetota bacterium]